MRLLCIYRPQRPESDIPPPQPEDMAKMGALIGEMTKAGVLLAQGGCQPSSAGARVRLEPNGKFTVTDGPFPETKELICGYCILDVKTMAEAQEWTKRFLTTAGRGESEIRPLYEGPQP